MNKITLDELVSEISAQEALIHEPDETYHMLTRGMEEVAEAARSGKVTILSDYDADGICSAYIMEHLVKAINPECEVAVSINDRRGAYGLSPDVQGDGESRYIVCDMGCNQLSFARERLGENVIIIDHHLIEDKSVAEEFVRDHRLVNPHAFHEDESMNSQYCATGLAFRLFQLADNVQAMQEMDDKTRNTVAAMACIGTAADMVDVLDVNSFNRTILKQGCEIIDKADESNFDFVIGNVLAKCGIKDGVTAHQLAFNVGAFLNSASRMSEIIEENGAQLTYDAITGDPSRFQTYRTIDSLMDLNGERKKMMERIQDSPEYQSFIQDQRHGEHKGDNIAVVIVNDIPHSFAGLIAGKLSEATDKAIICLAHDTETDTYSGSARNGRNCETSLKAFMDYAVSKEAELFGDERLQIRYGGHEDAMGISSLKDAQRLMLLIDETKSEMKAIPLEQRTVLDISLSDLKPDCAETIAKLQAIEPVGVGNELPLAVIHGTETFHDKGFKSGKPYWKTVSITATDDKTAKLKVSDWSYSEASYPQTGKKEVATLAEISLSDYKGIHVELTAKPDRAFDAERAKEVELEKAEAGKGSKKQSKSKDDPTQKGDD